MSYDLEYEYGRFRLQIVPPLGYVTFVAKVQKARTRKDKDYFVLRVTIPKDVAKDMDTQPGDFLLFRAKKAEWHHMLDWNRMQTAWELLPQQIKNKIFMEGLPYPGHEEMTFPLGTSPSLQAYFPSEQGQIASVQTDRR